MKNTYKQGSKVDLNQSSMTTPSKRKLETSAFNYSDALQHSQQVQMENVKKSKDHHDVSKQN